MVKTAVIIATHERIAITKANIECLKQQTLVPEIVIACTHKTEAAVYRHMGAHVVITQNTPLGNKWQAAVDTAKKLSPDILITCGSDDILHHDYIRKCHEWVGFGFKSVGLQQWYVFDMNKLYHFKYKASIPLGGGRAYSAEFLDSIKWRLFESKHKHLDSYGWQSVVRANVRRETFHVPLILSIKGPWPTMNPIEKFWNSPNSQLIKICDKSIMDTEFNYKCAQ